VGRGEIEGFQGVPDIGFLANVGFSGPTGRG
jgi:hypothetical protein